MYIAERGATVWGARMLTAIHLFCGKSTDLDGIRNSRKGNRDGGPSMSPREAKL